MKMNSIQLKQDLQRLPILLTGLFILSIGIYLVNLAYIGLAPWSVLHDGLAIVLDTTFGNVTIVLGLIILVISVVTLKTKIGLGTILNIMIVGNLINLYELFYNEKVDVLWMQIIVFSFGFFLTTFGRSLYIASNLGSGPRDSLFVGIARVTKYQVKHIKPVLELLVIIIGVLLGGNLGVGTVVLMGFSGLAVQSFFKILGFDPKTKKQSDVLLYFKTIKSN